MYKRLLLLTSIFILFSLCYSDGPLTVKNLRVEDNPGDDGSGLVIKFEPLNGHNIIEYRIYRGVTKDSLFFLGKLEVDAKIGISGNEVTFFDKDYRTLVDIDSPRKLQREKGQKEGSPIFKALPRDLTITGPMFQRFSTLVIIDRNRFYRTTEEYIRKTENGRELLGALRLAHTEGVLANVLPGLRYYYTVIAVDERRHYHPHAEIVSGVAVDNKPAKPDKFFALYIEDINQINFEFDSSMSANDIAQYSVFIMYKDQIAQYHKFVEYMDTVDELYMRFPTAEAHAQIYEILPQEVEIPGHQVFASYHTFGSVNIEDGCFAGTDIVFEKEEIDDYLFFLSFDDYGGFQSLSDPIPLKITNSSALPQLPDFVVRDKPADKGDANEILIGKPQAAITQINYRGHGKNRNKLSVAYSYSPLPFYHIKSIDFHFVTTDDKPLKTITRHYFDNVFNVTLPSTINTDDGFKVYISFDASGSDFHQKKLYHQEIYYDKDLLKLKPGPTYLEGEEMLKYRYLILRQSRADTDFSVAAKISPLINISEDIVGEKYVFKGVSGYDIAKKKILFTTDFDMGFDPQAGTMRMSNLFNSYYKDILLENINYYHTMQMSDPDNDELNEKLEYYRSIEDTYLEYSPFAAFDRNTTNKKRIKDLLKYRDFIKNSYRYKLVKTDTEGLFAVSDVYIDPNGNEYFLPYSNFFNIKNMPMLIATLIFSFFVFLYYFKSKKGHELFLRPIAGLEEIDNAIGRATEMGRPILFVPGLGYIEDIATLAALSILGYITKRAAVYDTRIIVPCHDYIVLPIAQQIVKESFAVAGRPDSYNANDVFFISDSQFAYVAGVNGIMIRDKTATNFYMGMFFAEALIMTETGNSTGAIQIAGCDEMTQIPFFITTCDYTLIGEELYAASAYMTKDPIMLGTLKSQDYTKMLIIICIVVGAILSTAHITGFVNWFPAE